MTEAEKVVELVTSRGFDEMSAAQRRTRAQELLRLPDPTDSESDELDVLLLMAVGLNEAAARADLLLRRNQNRSRRGGR